MYYILKGKEFFKCKDIEEYIKLKGDSIKRVAETISDEIRVSTVFLGLDHSYDGKGPVLFETMIFGGEHDQDQWRYKTWDEAEEGHFEACKIAGVLIDGNI